MFKKVLLGLGLLIGGFLIYVAMQPAEFSVTREVAIKAPAEAIFPYINNSRKMNSWNPWSKVDPQAQMEFSGPEEGVFAKTSWDSKGQMGTGSATVMESVENGSVRTKLEYTKPFAMTQDAIISLIPSGDSTIVRWSVGGKNSFIGRVFCTFMNMDKQVGGTFEQGLATLKSMVEIPGD